MRRNNRTNTIIKRLVIAGDFVLLNLVLYGLCLWFPGLASWSAEKTRIFFLVCNLALLISEWHRHTIIHQRLVSAGDVLKRIIQLTAEETLMGYVLLRVLEFPRVGKLMLIQGIVLLVLMVMARLAERTIIKRYRQRGGNSRMVTFVGNDSELETVRGKLMNDPTYGYSILATYQDVEDFVRRLKSGEITELGDELYLCVSRREKELVKHLSVWCDQRMVWFFYVPTSAEAVEVNMKRELLDDIEVYVTYDNPLQNPLNSFIKRVSDIVVAVIFLTLSAILFPFIWLMIKRQSPGPILFRQQRTGLDGKAFTMLKFRSMHVNKESDTLQATKDDPRKYPFGNFMRRTNIDEVPQFWNVLKGDMSIVGPRPHMLKHTEMYSKLIDKYMVRHFVKPGMTGWAQVTGFRGETKELWQMEERVRRDIWYMEHWSIWLDLRIIWMTAKQVFVRDKKAY